MKKAENGKGRSKSPLVPSPIGVEDMLYQRGRLKAEAENSNSKGKDSGSR